MVNVGLDLGKRKSQLCIQSADGAILAEIRVNTTAAELLEALRRFPGATVLVESSTGAFWVARALEASRYKVIVADPRFNPMYAQANKRVKTDKRDARALADALRMRAFKPVHRKSDRARRLHGLLKARAQLVRKRTSLICFVRTQCERDGVVLRSVRATRFATAVDGVAMDQALFAIVSPMLTAIEALSAQIQTYDEELAREEKELPVAALLQTTPGVGRLTALAFIAAIDDPKRFESPRALASYLGLVPGERNSGDSKRQPGAITKAGDVLARSYLVEASHTILMRKSPSTPLKDWGGGIARRKTATRKVTAVAVARRLARILWAMWRDDKPFEASRTAAATPDARAA